MVWNHLAAIFLFSGPLFYVGLYLALDPAGAAGVPAWLVRRAAGFALGPSAGNGQVMSHRLRTALRIAGIVLLLLGIAL